MSLDPRSIAEPLLDWYRRHGRSLPWRETSDPYEIWVSEVMLQQTRVETGLRFYPRFLERFPTVLALAEAEEDEVLAAWSGLGFYRRARNLHRAARVVVEEHGGQVPRDPEALGALPGVGRYTVGAILSAAHGDRLPILDGNVTRVLSRLFGVDTPIDRAATKRELWGLAEAVLPERDAGTMNQALMDFGATLCTPSNPRCLICPLAGGCFARREQRQDELPLPGKRARVVFQVRVGLFLQRGDGRFGLTQRPREGLLPGLWELPSAELELPGGEAAGEARALDLAKAAARDLLRRHGGGRLLERAGTAEHRFSHRHWTTHVWSAAGTGDAKLRWVRESDLQQLGVPTASRKAIELGLAAGSAQPRTGPGPAGGDP